MRLIIAGSRDFTDRTILHRAIHYFQLDTAKITTVLCGCARGMDALGAQWAQENGIEVETFPADWERYGPSAGPRRNRTMARQADALLLVHKDGRGSRSMLREARKRNLMVWQRLVDRVTYDYSS